MHLISARRLSLAPLLLLSAALLTATPAGAHCDAIDGPVVKDARLALEDGDITPVLKWVAEPQEVEIRTAFDRAIRVRGLSPDARDLADQHFFETVVRLHRESEGAPFTGLKPAGSDFGPAVQSADAALASGSVDELADLLLAAADEGLRQRFTELMRAHEHANHSVEAGRHFTHVYADFVHYAKHLHEAAAGSPAHSEVADHH